MNKKITKQSDQNLLIKIFVMVGVLLIFGILYFSMGGYNMMGGNYMMGGYNSQFFVINWIMWILIIILIIAGIYWLINSANKK